MFWWNLRQLRSPSDYIRIEAARKLGESGDARAVEPLVSALKDSNSKVRTNVAIALGKLGSPHAVESLIAALKDSDIGVRNQAGNSLKHLGYSPSDEVRQAEFFIACQDWNSAAKVSASFDLLILAMKDPSASVRYNAVMGLGKIQNPQAVVPLIAALNDHDLLMRNKAVKALGEIGKATVEPLIVALDEADTRAETDIKHALVEVGGAAVAPLLTTLNDSSPELFRKVSSVLGKLGDARAVGPLVVFLSDSRPLVSWHASVALGEIGEPAVESLINALNDPNSKVRESVAEALGTIGDARVVEPLIGALKDTSHSVRQRAHESLGKIGRANIRPLISALDDQDIHIAEKCAETLIRVGATSNPALRQFLERLRQHQELERLHIGQQTTHKKAKERESLGTCSRCRREVFRFTMVET